MKRIHATLSVLIMGTLLPAPALQAASAENGAGLFESFGCYQCHQYSGAGYLGVPGGAPLVPMRFPVEGFVAYIRNPPLANRMPPYTEQVMSEAQARDIYAYIQSLPQPQPKEDIELLRNIIGELEAAD